MTMKCGVAGKCGGRVTPDDDKGEAVSLLALNQMRIITQSHP